MTAHADGEVPQIIPMGPHVRQGATRSQVELLRRSLHAHIDTMLDGLEYDGDLVVNPVHYIMKRKPHMFGLAGDRMANVYTDTVLLLEVGETVASMIGQLTSPHLANYGRGREVLP